MPIKGKTKLEKKRDQYFKNISKYEKDHGRKPSWAPKSKKKGK